ncbi:Hsp20/alpha crystallin family protein [Spirochaeta africana]|uniref:Molecular chaperone (Small heat shock protein) n=1 Tax=Spirochaeta africana (strain ATCC 700263 / DSM 8902 / Z-7692) TaxID=889378 RepID=H9UGC8_SPIAZ|nr:Hsp20/alpha crystallin family protein [Spirochaeta africana]AFG36571.1 molecular chaperone (small heat shock protein) [Spirochaeta africana DSM 8902]
MNLVTWNSPMRALQDWEQDLDRLFESFLMDRGGRWSDVYPRLDVVEREDAYDIYADLPGVRREDVDVSLTSNVLTIKGTRHSETREKEAGVTREESGSFERSITLPEGIDGEKVAARMENGVLSLHIPKSAAATARKIQISDAAGK